MRRSAPCPAWNWRSPWARRGYAPAFGVRGWAAISLSASSLRPAARMSRPGFTFAPRRQRRQHRQKTLVGGARLQPFPGMLGLHLYKPGSAAPPLPRRPESRPSWRAAPSSFINTPDGTSARLFSCRLLKGGAPVGEAADCRSRQASCAPGFVGAASPKPHTIAAIWVSNKGAARRLQEENFDSWRPASHFTILGADQLVERRQSMRSQRINDASIPHFRVNSRHLDQHSLDNSLSREFGVQRQ